MVTIFKAFIALSFSLLIATAISSPALSQSMKPQEWSAIKPTLKNGVWTLTIQPERCSAADFGDGRGESDCTNGTLRSQIRGNPVTPTTAREYSFEIKVPDGFSYQESLRYRPYGSIEIALWQHIEGIKNHLYEFRLSPRSGILFDGQTCIRPDEYGSWARIVFQIDWTEEETGFLQVICNGRIIVSRRGQTLVPQNCGTEIKPQCKPDLLRSDKPINWYIGLMFYGFGPDWKEYGRQSPFLPFPGSEVTVQMRNISERNIRLSN